MREGKTRRRSRRFSVVVVPHAADDAAVLRFSASYTAAFVVALFALAALVCAGLLTFATLRENNQLRSSRGQLKALNSEQTKEIRRLSAATIAYNDTIKAFTTRYGQIAKSYLSDEGGAACSSAADCASIGSIASSGAQLQSALQDLRQADPTGTAGSSSKLESDLSLYLSALPTDWPVQGAVTSPFGGRLDPFSGGASFHPGLDITAPYGERVVAAGSGVVVSAGNKGDGYGNKVVISHGDTISTLYGHLSAILVKKGEEVKEGDPIGRVGSTGRSTGDHLHFEIRVDGTPVNPLAYLASDKKK
jgi:murein DD-endopeptidase MepM/ murein hydrolase activator NlpD